MKLFEKMTITNFIIIFLILICVYYIITTFITVKTYEHLENVSATVDTTVVATTTSGTATRTIDNYATNPTDKYRKFVKLSSTINGVKFYLANVPKTYYNASCTVCNSVLSSKPAENVVMLVNSKNVQSRNCVNNNIMTCLNSNSGVGDCDTYGATQCNANLLNDSNCAFLLRKIDNAYLLVLGVDKMTFFADASKSNVVCMEQSRQTTNENSINFEITNSSAQQFQFKMYYNINNVKQYIGYTTTQLCPQTTVSTVSTDGLYNVALYSDSTNANILTFMIEVDAIES